MLSKVALEAQGRFFFLFFFFCQPCLPGDNLEMVRQGMLFGPTLGVFFLCRKDW